MPNHNYVTLAWQRFIHLWWLKALGTSTFMGLFFYAYFALMRAPAYPVTVMPMTGIDDYIAFHPIWFYVYLSLWLYTSLVPALMVNLYKLLEFTCFIGLLCVSGLLVFYFYPTTVMFEHTAWSRDPLVLTLRTIDKAGNAFPSLHVASAVFSAMCLRRILTDIKAPIYLQGVSMLWCAGIVFSTLAIKQHVVWDVLGGVVLAVIVDTCYRVRLQKTHP
jgi:PAP2 superfamily